MKSKKTLFVLMAMLFAVSVLFAGCATQPSAAATSAAASVAASAPASASVQASASASASAATSSATGKKLTFVIVIPNIHPFFDPITVGARDKLKQMGIDADVECEGAQNGNVAQQIQIMEDLVTKKVDGIAIGACDSKALTPYIDKAVEAGIPVVSFDTDSPDSKRAGYIGTNNEKAGEAMGEVLGQALNGKGNVICETGVASQAGLLQRIEGVKTVLDAKYPNVKIIEQEASGGDVSKGLSDIENMITAHPDFNALINMDASGENGVNAFKSHGWTTKDKILITFDDLDPVILGVKNGQIYATITQGQYNWGVNIAAELYDLTQGKTIPANTDTGYVVINKDNVDAKYPNVK